MACPFCRKWPVWYSRSLFKGFIRMLIFSPRRYCFACGRRWQRPSAMSAFVGLAVHPWVLMGALCLSVGFVLAVLGNVDFNPVRWFKAFVRQRYDRKYGEKSQEMMWRDLGKYYRSQGSAEADYANHPQDRRRGGAR